MPLLAAIHPRFKHQSSGDLPKTAVSNMAHDYQKMTANLGSSKISDYNESYHS